MGGSESDLDDCVGAVVAARDHSNFVLKFFDVLDAAGLAHRKTLTHLRLTWLRGDLAGYADTFDYSFIIDVDVINFWDFVLLLKCCPLLIREYTWHDVVCVETELALRVVTPGEDFTIRRKGEEMLLACLNLSDLFSQ